MEAEIREDHEQLSRSKGCGVILEKKMRPLILAVLPDFFP